MSDPGDQHVEHAVHILHYLSGTRDLKLVLWKFGSGPLVGSSAGDGNRYIFCKRNAGRGVTPEDHIPSQKHVQASRT
jgi:hypothetical protein